MTRLRNTVEPSPWLAWTKLLTRFLSFEALVQALGFTAGIILVRALPKAEYGLFTIANTIQQTMNVLADSGIGPGLTSIGGRVWHDRFRFGQLLNTAMRLRRSFALIAIVIVTPVLVWLLLGNGAKPAYATIIAAIVLLGLYFQLSASVLIVAPRLHLAVNRIQLLSVGSAALRLLLIVAAYGVLLNAAAALLAASISFGMQEFLLRRWVPRMADLAAPPHADDHAEILSIARAQAPNSIFFCIQSQLTIWLISVFGSSSAVAEVGALGRLSVIFLTIGAFLGNVVYPRFARVQDAPTLWRRYWQVLGVFCLLSVAMLLLAATVPEALLWLLGPKYAHLEHELFLMILGAVLQSIAGTMWGLNMTKGWIISPWAWIPTGIVTQILLICLLDLSRVRDVLILNIFASIPGLFLNFWRTRQGIRGIRA